MGRNQSDCHRRHRTCHEDIFSECIIKSFHFDGHYTFFDPLRGLPTFIEIWTRVVRYLETQATSPSQEVSMRAIGHFQDIFIYFYSPLHTFTFIDIIIAHVAQPTCPQDVREITWVALERLAVCLTSFPEISSKSVTSFAHPFLSDLYTKTRTFIVPANMRRLIRMTYPLAIYVDPKPPATTGIAVGQPSTIQASILTLLQTMPPLPDNVYPLVFSQLLLYVSHAIGYHNAYFISVSLS
jgi:hypothetical protein